MSRDNFPNQIRFPSLMNGSKYGFVLNKDWQEFWDTTRRHPIRFLSDRCGFYETYGDGLVQHSPACAVTIEMWEDYCLSLANHVLTHSHHLAFVGDVLHSQFCRMANMRQYFTFYMSLRYDEKKPHRYFSTDSDFFGKVSASESKRHDKRWTAIPSEADGSAKFIWSMLGCYPGGLHDSALKCFTLREQFQDLCREYDVWCPERPGEYVGIEASQQGICYETLKNVVVSGDKLDRARQWIESSLERLNVS